MSGYAHFFLFLFPALDRQVLSTGAPGSKLRAGFLEVKGSFCPEGVQSLVEKDRPVNSHVKVLLRSIAASWKSTEKVPAHLEVGRTGKASRKKPLWLSPKG